MERVHRGEEAGQRGRLRVAQKCRAVITALMICFLFLKSFDICLVLFLVFKDQV
jgi:hypothetical protein